MQLEAICNPNLVLLVKQERRKAEELIKTKGRDRAERHELILCSRLNTRCTEHTTRTSSCLRRSTKCMPSEKSSCSFSAQSQPCLSQYGFIRSTKRSTVRANADTLTSLAAQHLISNPSSPAFSALCSCHSKRVKRKTKGGGKTKQRERCKRKQGLYMHKRVRCHNSQLATRKTHIHGCEELTVVGFFIKRLFPLSSRHRRL